VRIDDPGRLASDYHTAQAPKDVEIRRWTKKNGPIRTRSDELDCDDLKTILSQREFRTGSLYTICLWRHNNAECASLDDIASALRAPEFAPFAGRKAHPLMFPLLPSVDKRPDPIIEAESVADAFGKFDHDLDQEPAALRLQIGVQVRTHRPIFADADAIPVNERVTRVAQFVERRDVPESRAKWRFGLRAEALLRSTATEGDAS
jgi:CRISPR system Cascade subunit CasD